MYRDDPDPGVHSSLGYLLLRWGMTRERAAPRRRAGGQAAGPSAMARQRDRSDAGDRRAGRAVAGRPRLAIATTETTVEQYRPFDPGHRARAEQGPRPDARPTPMRRSAPSRTTTPRGTATGSASERASRRKTGATSPARPRGTWSWPRITSSRRGYRLPTLMEWEFAARAGTTTDRYFGRSLRHAAAYAWYSRNTDNHAEPVGRKRPNDFGLFDVLGNLVRVVLQPRPAPRRPLRLPGHQRRRLPQGPAGFHPGRELLPAGRQPDRPGLSPTLDRLYPDESLRYIGFRVARSVP